MSIIAKVFAVAQLLKLVHHCFDFYTTFYTGCAIFYMGICDMSSLYSILSILFLLA